MDNINDLFKLIVNTQLAQQQSTQQQSTPIDVFGFINSVSTSFPDVKRTLLSELSKYFKNERTPEQWAKFFFNYLSTESFLNSKDVEFMQLSFPYMPKNDVLHFAAERLAFLNRNSYYSHSYVNKGAAAQYLEDFYRKDEESFFLSQTRETQLELLTGYYVQYSKKKSTKKTTPFMSIEQFFDRVVAHKNLFVQDGNAKSELNSLHNQVIGCPIDHSLYIPLVETLGINTTQFCKSTTSIRSFISTSNLEQTKWLLDVAKLPESAKSQMIHSMSYSEHITVGKGIRVADTLLDICENDYQKGKFLTEYFFTVLKQHTDPDDKIKKQGIDFLMTYAEKKAKNSVTIRNKFTIVTTAKIQYEQQQLERSLSNLSMDDVSEKHTEQKNTETQLDATVDKTVAINVAARRRKI